MATTHRIDLTELGFTSTESLAYQALLQGGPSSGYAVGKSLGIARANAYQALNGLVMKGAAKLLEEEPRRFRAVNPESLLALLVQRETRKLDLLERQVREFERSAEPSVVGFRGLRQLTELALRTATRAEGQVSCLAPFEVLEALKPIWRRRQADRAPTTLVAVGPPAEDPEVVITGEIDPERALSYFAGDPVLLVTSGPAIAGSAHPEPSGYWTSDPLWCGAVRATLEHLSAP
ncbi:MAG: TrmB family transcriptional regulator [Gemmatimonadales bacterium]